MKQRATRSIPEIKAKFFEIEKMAAFLYGLTKGDTLYSPLFGYLNVKETNASGIVVSLFLPDEHDAYDILFRCNGRLANFERGECMLFLSHLYRSWNVLNFQPGDIVAMDIKNKDGYILTYIVIFNEVDFINSYPKIRTYACLCKNSDELTSYSQLDLQGTCAEEVSIELRYATPTEEKLLNNAVERIGKRWDKRKQRLLPLFSEDPNPNHLREDFNALQKEYNRLTEYCIKLEHERDEALKKAGLEAGRMQGESYEANERMYLTIPQTDD